jgi:HAD superfamily hydrolase (TIGR01509 family)
LNLFDAILWDMDGTLVDSEPIWAEEERKLMAEYGVLWQESDSVACLGGPISKLDAYMRNLVQEKLEPNVLADELVNRMANRLASDTQYAPGAYELLCQFRDANLPMALVTASNRSIVNSVLSSFEEKFFRVAICSEDVAISKPNPEGYLLAAKMLDVDIHRCLIIEDSLTGMTAAKDSGAYLLGINPHPKFEMKDRFKSVVGLAEVSMEYLYREFLEIIKP